MLKFACIAAAANHAKRTGNTDGLEALAMVFVVFPLAILILGIFVAMPIAAIIGGANLISGNIDLANELLGTGLLGCLLGLVVGLASFWAIMVEIFTPAPWYFEKDKPDYEERMKKFKKGSWLFGLAAFALAAIITLMAVGAFMFFESNPIFSGVLFIVLSALSIVGSLAFVFLKLFVE